MRNKMHSVKWLQRHCLNFASKGGLIQNMGFHYVEPNLTKNEVFQQSDWTKNWRPFKESQLPISLSSLPISLWNKDSFPSTQSLFLFTDVAERYRSDKWLSEKYRTQSTVAKVVCYGHLRFSFSAQWLGRTLSFSCMCYWIINCFRVRAVLWEETNVISPTSLRASARQYARYISTATHEANVLNVYGGR